VVTLKPSLANSRTASSVEVSGNLSITVAMAPIPIATAGTRDSPGRWDPATPMTPPMNMAGKMGPPRNADRDTA